MFSFNFSCFHFWTSVSVLFCCDTMLYIILNSLKAFYVAAAHIIASSFYRALSFKEGRPEYSIPAECTSDSSKQKGKNKTIL